MSSYNPPEEQEDGSSHDPGVKEKAITDQRGFSETLTDFDTVDYLLLGLVSSTVAGMLTVLLLLEFSPEYQDTAATLLRELGAIISNWVTHYLERYSLFEAVPDRL